ncbi:hypothetical protein BDA99DRAFT_101446 [Phascolomyces articulosus]|uniref:Uncharacterized protein n=1 Tax=Phascolomyces articulosus TaxID=60185 RepID=A0AAD5K7L3_9FUNG|nr:hypothetical protein BDA99DRAFT_101446 [Phascolomyces articulosus]
MMCYTVFFLGTTKTLSLFFIHINQKKKHMHIYQNFISFSYFMNHMHYCCCLMVFFLASLLYLCTWGGENDLDYTPNLELFFFFFF